MQMDPLVEVIPRPSEGVTLIGAAISNPVTANGSTKSNFSIGSGATAGAGIDPNTNNTGGNDARLT